MHAEERPTAKWQCAARHESDACAHCLSCLPSFKGRKLGRVCVVTTDSYSSLLFPWLCVIHIKLSVMAKMEKPTFFFFSRYKKRKILFVSILLLILVNIDRVSLTVQHFCFVLCIFQLSLNSLFSFLWFFWSYFWNIAHDSFFKPIKKSHVNLCILFYALGKGISRWNIHKVLHNKFSLATKSIHQVYRIVLSP